MGKKDNSQKKRILIIVVLLLLALLIAGYFWKKEQAPSNISFTLQGETKIGKGKIRIQLFDDQAEDGDTVNVFLDNKLLQKNVALLNDPVEVPLGKLKKGEYLLGIEAVAEGFPPATASIYVVNEEQKSEKFQMHATKEAAASWKLIIE